MAAALAAILAVSLCGCNNDSESNSSQSVSSSESSESSSSVQSSSESSASESEPVESEPSIDYVTPGEDEFEYESDAAAGGVVVTAYKGTEENVYHI